MKERLIFLVIVLIGLSLLIALLLNPLSSNKSLNNQIIYLSGCIISQSSSNPIFIKINSSNLTLIYNSYIPNLSNKSVSIFCRLTEYQGKQECIILSINQNNYDSK